MAHRRLLLLVLLPALFAGCRSVGPGTVARDRFDYGDSIADSWKRQTLLNIVRLRYMDPPSFVEIGQIVAGYSLETGASVGGQLSSSSAIQGNSVTLGGSGRFTDRPTITYLPLTGARFLQGLMTPFRPEDVFAAIQSGLPADAILFAALRSMNGLKNSDRGTTGVRDAEPEFLRCLELIRTLQDTGTVGFRLVRGTDGTGSSILAIRSARATEEAREMAAELRRLLGLSAEATEFRLAFGSVPRDDTEIAVLTRSMLHVMAVMAAEVDVP